MPSGSGQRSSALDLVTRHRPAQERDRPARLEQMAAAAGLRIADDEPSRPQSLEHIAQLRGGLALSGLVRKTVEDTRAVGVRLQPAEAPQAGVGERAR
jgi:hypothetical protein